jgi:hypothetical protein
MLRVIFPFNVGMRTLVILFIAFCMSSPPVQSQGNHENPAASGWESGIGVVSGWHCSANRVTFKFICSTTPYCNQIFEAATGTYRPDTQSACNDTNNGYSSLINYNELGDGQHTIIVYADDVEFASATFNVTTLGQGYITDIVPATAYSEIYISQHNKALVIEWQQSKQNFGVVGVYDAPYTYSQLVNKLKGNWAGNWASRSSGGAMSMQLDSSTIPGFGVLVHIYDVDLANISCDQGNFDSYPVLNWSQAIAVLQYHNDGSGVSYEFLYPAYHNETLTGTFLYGSGPCANTFGSFTLFKQN